ncbi:ArsR/SmtB family transcription factor [Klenkia terrae]|uniref:ArsR/SmtB family transcription factor n=1 Tax=Klenkia terrae TaxID=1052259 RepID=UPI00361EA4D0
MSACRAAGGERRPATDAEAKALASGVRLRILRLCLDRPLTNREIAIRLERNPASVLHHVRTLVDTGFLVAEPARRGARGAREVPYRATGRSWQLDLSDQPAPARDPILAAFLGEVAAVGSPACAAPGWACGWTPRTSRSSPTSCTGCSTAGPPGRPTRAASGGRSTSGCTPRTDPGGKAAPPAGVVQIGNQVLPARGACHAGRR